MIIGAKRWEQKATVFRRTATRAVAVLLKREVWKV